MVRTSITHPLQVFYVNPAPGFGRIGITFCPGKKDATSPGGAWDRDLHADLDVIQDLEASMLVTLIEDFEFGLLKVEALGTEVVARNMRWIHIPIKDVSIPDRHFEVSWATVGKQLRSQLRDGYDIVVHCRGGLGRAGIVAARLLIELGAMNSKDAVKLVRAVRPGAIETSEQEDYVHRIKPVVE